MMATQSNNSYHRLFSALLHRQREPEHSSFISDKRLREALTTGPGFCEEETRQIWRSPVVRANYQRIKDDILEAIEALFTQHAFNLTLTTQTAFSSSDARQYSSDDGSFTLDIFRLNNGDWLISLNLSDALLDILQNYPQIHLQLIDDQGHEWLCQQFANLSRLTTRWQHEMDPNEQLRTAVLYLNIL